MVKIFQEDFDQTGIAVVQEYNSNELTTKKLYENDIIFETRRLLEAPHSTIKSCFELYGCIASSKCMFNLNVLLYQVRRFKKKHAILPENFMQDLRLGVFGLERKLKIVHKYLYC